MGLGDPTVNDGKVAGQDSCGGGGRRGGVTFGGEGGGPGWCVGEGGGEMGSREEGAGERGRWLEEGRAPWGGIESSIHEG